MLIGLFTTCLFILIIKGKTHIASVGMLHLGKHLLQRGRGGIAKVPQQHRQRSEGTEAPRLQQVGAPPTQQQQAAVLLVRGVGQVLNKRGAAAGDGTLPGPLKWRTLTLKYIIITLLLWNGQQMIFFCFYASKRIIICILINLKFLYFTCIFKILYITLCLEYGFQISGSLIPAWFTFFHI